MTMVGEHMQGMLEDALDLCQGVLVVDCPCSAFYFHGTCDHVNKTILLVDDLPGEPSLEYFEDHDRCIILDGIKVHNDRLVKRLRLQDVLEDIRRKIVYCMINGLTLVVRCGNKAVDWLTCNDEHCPDLDPQYESHPPYNRLSYVPDIWLLNGGARLKNDTAWARRLMRREDLERGTVEPGCHPHFGIIFTTTIGHEEVEQRLFDGVIGLPKGQFDIIEMSDMTNDGGGGEG
jgi:hypothetical protein